MCKRRGGIRVTLATILIAVIIPGTGRTENRGVQITPDGKRVLVNKDVGVERWAITLNENGSATGNVYRMDGGPSAFVFCTPRAAPNTFDCFGADPCRDTSGVSRVIQGVPDTTRVLVQKDVGAERWAISQNLDDGTATGNVYRSGGDEPAFVACTPAGIPDTFDCAGADKCRETPCAESFVPIATVTLPQSFFLLPDPCVETYTPLGSVVLPDHFFEPTTTVAVTFSLGVSAPVQGFDIRVSYPRGEGSFVGSAGDVQCASDGNGAFVKNEIESLGSLALLQTNHLGLMFPVTIRCPFGAVGTVVASDFNTVVREVTQNNAVGDPSALTVRVTVE